MTLDDYCLPEQINQGPWLTAYSLPELLRLAPRGDVVLPICSLGTPFERLAEFGRSLVLPPLYHEALDQDLKTALVERIHECFPFLSSDSRRQSSGAALRVVELPPREHPVSRSPFLGFSVDTAVEEHGPHLPLATDRIQSYGVLGQLADEFPSFRPAVPVDYGHLTWGLPFGMSIDTTPELLTRYVTRFTDALVRLLRPRGIYVVDVHGSIVHRDAIQEGLRRSICPHWAFRWLHEPLVEYAAERGDQHAGGVETILVERINPKLVDRNWFPTRTSEIIEGQMSLEAALELSADLPEFVRQAADRNWNGIVGRIENYEQLDAELLWNRMTQMARDDLRELIAATA